MASLIPQPAEPTETDAEHRDRLAWEDRMIAEAEADSAAGRFVRLEAVRAWVESLGTAKELPPPKAELPGR